VGRILKHGVVLLLVMGIAFVFISPVLHLQPTAMRAWQAAQLVMIALVVSASAIVGFQEVVFRQLAVTKADLISDRTADLVDLDCSRLC
jgi:hypothetical protein